MGIDSIGSAGLDPFLPTQVPADAPEERNERLPDDEVSEQPAPLPAGSGQTIDVRV